MGTIALNGKGTRVSISPRDNHVVAVSGDKILKILRVQENTFKYLGDITIGKSTGFGEHNLVEKLNLNQKFTEHVWADEQKLLGKLKPIEK